MFDIDLYVDQKVAGDGNFVVNAAAVDAFHAAGGHAICYVDAGDAERTAPTMTGSSRSKRRAAAV